MHTTNQQNRFYLYQARNANKLLVNRNEEKPCHNTTENENLRKALHTPYNCDTQSILFPAQVDRRVNETNERACSRIAEDCFLMGNIGGNLQSAKVERNVGNATIATRPLARPHNCHGRKLEWRQSLILHAFTTPQSFVVISRWETTIHF